jgi:CDGSH-type Zn-finger protein
MSDVTLTLRPNGPILVSGPVTLKDTQGSTYDLAGKETIALCRCSHSQNRPFCDGSHKSCGFEGQETVPAT